MASTVAQIFDSTLCSSPLSNHSNQSPFAKKCLKKIERGSKIKPQSEIYLSTLKKHDRAGFETPKLFCQILPYHVENAQLGFGLVLAGAHRLSRTRLLMETFFQ